VVTDQQTHAARPPVANTQTHNYTVPPSLARCNLNVDKSGVTTFGTAARLLRCNNHCGRRRQFSTCQAREKLINLLGVIIDSNLRFDKHAAAIAKECNYDTYALRQSCPTKRREPSPAALSGRD